MYKQNNRCFCCNKKFEYEHIFDSNAVYVSETGNYHGKCKDCGTEICCYTGSYNIKPCGVHKFEKIVGTGSNLKVVDYLKKENKLHNDRMPMLIIEHPECKYPEKFAYIFMCKDCSNATDKMSNEIMKKEDERILKEIKINDINYAPPEYYLEVWKYPLERMLKVMESIGIVERIIELEDKNH